MDCPIGFGGDDCASPLCNSLGAPKRAPPEKPSIACQCDSDWTGLNCNVCENDDACRALKEFQGINATCYKKGIVVHELFRSCDARLSYFYDKLLRGKKAKITVDCKGDPKRNDVASCAFQFWLDFEPNFYCKMDNCLRQRHAHSTNATYLCPNIRCQCRAKASLCDAKQIIDLAPLLKEVQGPAKLDCDEHGNCTIHEPQLNAYFGETGLALACATGECLRPSQVPGYEPPAKAFPVWTFLLVTLAAALLIVALILGFFYCLRGQSDLLAGSYGRPCLSPEEETRLLMDSHIPSKLIFKNLSYNIGSHWILHNLSGSVLPGQVLAIMGGSGSGKTSSLDILAGKSKKGSVHGDILVNGAKYTPENRVAMRGLVGYVDQEDTLLDTLTVRETLTYSALLRLPTSMSLEAKKLRVQQTLEELSIEHIADRIVGRSESRGISGGEKRRLSIAQELVTSPSLLFLDEPTSGLDSYNAYNVMEAIVTLAKRYNRTIVCTIHQPRSDIFAMFDKLLLLSCGQMLYSGPVADIPNYLTSIGLPCPMGYNMADHLLDTALNIDEESDFTLPSYNNVGAMGASAGAAGSAGVGSGWPASSSNSPRLSVGGGTGRLRPISSLLSREGHGTSLMDRLRSLVRAKRESCDTAEWISSKSHLLERRARVLSHHFMHSTYGIKFAADMERELPVSMAAAAVVSNASHSSSHTMADRSLSTGTASSGESGAEAANIEPILPILPTTFSPIDGRYEQHGESVVSSSSPDRPSFVVQVKILSGRTLVNLYRNPYLLMAHYGLSALLALFCGFLFFNVTDDMPGVQNRMGCLFFICAFFAFGSLTSLEFFAAERVLFIRERSNGYYSPLSYYISKVLFDLVPLRTVPPLLFGAIVYYLVGLYPTLTAFFKFLAVLVLFNLVSAAICLLIAVSFRYPALGNLTASLTILFSMLFGGFLLNKDRMPYLLGWIKYLSAFNYAYEAMIVNELKNINLHDDTIVDIDIPGTLILQQFGFNPNGYWHDAFVLFIMFLVALLIAFYVLKVLVKERK